MNSRGSGYEPLRPLDATPSPPGIVLTGSSQGMARRSVRTPDTGCATEGGTVGAAGERRMSGMYVDAGGRMPAGALEMALWM